MVIIKELNGAIKQPVYLILMTCHILTDPTALLGSVAQLDARPTGDQEVAGSTPAGVCNILSWRWIMKYFLRPFSPFC